MQGNAQHVIRIGQYMMPVLPPAQSDLGFLFGTRHGVEAFCQAALALWRQGMFARLLVSGGATGGAPEAEAEVIGARLVALGMPASVLILETAATNTGENVRLGRARVAAAMDLTAVRSVLVIGKMCSTRRYLMTLQRHWPGLRLTVCPVNYFGVADHLWHQHDEFRQRVLGEFDKIPAYLAAGFLAPFEDGMAYPFASHDVRQHIRDEVLSIAPLDAQERDDVARVLAWIDSGVPLCRVNKPATPPMHLVAYFAVIDDGHVLLVDHRNAQLWLPPGGHVEPDEDPRLTVARELEEELGFTLPHPLAPPVFVTVTTTVGLTAGHTDVSLWYVVRAGRETAMTFDAGEFAAIRWFAFDEVPLARADPQLGRFIAKLAAG